MNQTIRFFLFTVLAAWVLAGCGGSPAADSQEKLSGFNRDGLGTYSARFTVQYDGDGDWTYRLESRRAPVLREESLHIEGVDSALNPGDVRLVTDGKYTWMTGPGTDNECLQFPNQSSFDPELILPQTLLPPEAVSQSLRYVGEETILGKMSEHWSGTGLRLESWQEARVDVWIDKTSKALLRFEMKATATEDPFFDAGAGTLTARYEVSDLGAPAIEPVSGCEIAVPLPESAGQIVRLPGMASFDTPANLDEMRSFFQSALPPEGWAEREPPAVGDSAAVLSYQRGEENVEIQIRAREEGGSKVQIVSP